MPKIRFSSLAISQIQQFIRFYEEGFFDIYSGGGLWSLDLIVENYHHTAMQLEKQIFFSIKNRLEQEKVLGRKEKNSWSEVICYLGDRIIVIYFTEDFDGKVRTVRSVGIDRKPVIF